MDVSWLLRNIHRSWQRGATVVDCAKRLQWMYADKQPRWMCPSEFNIRFRHPPPVGRVDLLVRVNRGADAFIAGEVFEHEYYRLDLPVRPATVLDLGANAGFTAIYLSRQYPAAKVAAVEPIPQNLRVLERNLRANAPGVQVFAAAATAMDGVVTMTLDRDHTHKVVDPREAGSDQRVNVTGISIPTIMRRLGWERIGLLKVDIEGHEKTLFAANCEWLRLVDAMCIEIHDGFDESDLRSMAGEYGFLPPSRLPGIWLLRR